MPNDFEERRTFSDWMREVGARRERLPRVCVRCGRVTEPAPNSRRYCSNLCRQRAKYQRVRAARIAERLARGQPADLRHQNPGRKGRGGHKSPAA